MRYYSDDLKEFFNTPEECRKAEKQFLAKKEAEEKEQKEKAAAISKQKKELVDKINLAEEKLEKAYKDYDSAKECVKVIMEESNAKMEEILSAAKKAIKEAQAEKCDAIQKFNEKFGVYTAQYTGKKAEAELERLNKWFDNLFNW